MMTTLMNFYKVSVNDTLFIVVQLYKSTINPDSWNFLFYFNYNHKFNRDKDKSGYKWFVREISYVNRPLFVPTGQGVV